MNQQTKELIEREAERYAKEIWADHYQNVLPESVIEKGRKGYADAAIHGANFALEMDRWQTGMPDTDGVYMVTDGRDIGIVELFGGGWMHDMLMQIPDDAEITHFQTLPKLPQ